MASRRKGSNGEKPAALTRIIYCAQVGVMDDAEALAAAKPGVELYAGHRVDWVPEIPGAKQAQGMS